MKSCKCCASCIGTVFSVREAGAIRYSRKSTVVLAVAVNATLKNEHVPSYMSH